MRPTYVAFHAWLRANRNKITAGSGRSVIYSGADRLSGDKLVGVYRLLPKFADRIFKDTGVRPRWRTIETVLRDTFCTLPEYTDETLPDRVLRYPNMWDFACYCSSHSVVTKHENQQIWRNLSAWYAKNASGDVWVVEGERLKKYPDMFLAELAVLLKKNNVNILETEKRIDSISEYVPDFRARVRKYWKDYRSDTPKGRRAGR